MPHLSTARRFSARYRLAVALFVSMFLLMQASPLHRHVFDHAHATPDAGAHDHSAHSAYEESAAPDAQDHVHGDGAPPAHVAFTELDINPGGIAKFTFPLLFAWLFVLWVGAPLFIRWLPRAYTVVPVPRRLRALIAPPLRAPPR